MMAIKSIPGGYKICIHVLEDAIKDVKDPSAYLEAHVRLFEKQLQQLMSELRGEAK